MDAQSAAAALLYAGCMLYDVFAVAPHLTCGTNSRSWIAAEAADWAAGGSGPDRALRP